VTVFVEPDSFTGENLIEISGHGGFYVPAAILATLVSCGARPAEPGEFTRRAVLNGKLDIVQAEAIGDMVDARSEAMHRAALGQLDGGLSRRIERLRENIISVEALIAYDKDIPEEYDGPIYRESIAT
jgi:tRNA modification GTPase